MKIAITVICCLIPCIGMVLGMLMLFKGTKRKTETKSETKPGTLPGCFLVSSGRLILILALAELVLTLLVLFLAPVTGTKPRLMMTILLVTLQYISAMILIFVLNARMPHDSGKKQDKNEK